MYQLGMDCQSLAYNTIQYNTLLVAKEKTLMKCSNDFSSEWIVWNVSRTNANVELRPTFLKFRTRFEKMQRQNFFSPLSKVCYDDLVMNWLRYLASPVEVQGAAVPLPGPLGLPIRNILKHLVVGFARLNKEWVCYIISFSKKLKLNF